jgi:hypothetical protein
VPIARAMRGAGARSGGQPSGPLAPAAAWRHLSGGHQGGTTVAYAERTITRTLWRKPTACTCSLSGTLFGAAAPKLSASGPPPRTGARYLSMVTFRQRLLSTLRAIEPVLREPGVLVAGSEVPNLLEPDARSTLVVSQDVDIAVSVDSHARVKRQLASVRDLEPSAEEPSVWLPRTPDLIEVNFIGMDHGRRAGETYVLDDSELPLLVFGHLSLLQPGPAVVVDGLTIPVPRLAGLLIEKLVTDRTAEKGDRDLLVALGLLLVATPGDMGEAQEVFEGLAADLQYTARSNLTVLSLLQPRAGMPDPTQHRRRVGELLDRLEQTGANR